VNRRGQDWIGAELGLSPRTVARILRRHQVPCLHQCDPITGEVIRLRRSPRSATNAPGPANWSTSTSRNSAGFDYVHSMVDDPTRLAYPALPDEKGAT